MLHNTEVEIKTVGQSDLIPGRIYLIQHNHEGTAGLSILNPQITQEQINTYNTRFKAKFLRHEVGKQLIDPDGIKGLPQHLHVAVFEDVEIISRNKDQITQDVWVFSTNDNDQICAKYLGSYMSNGVFDDDADDNRTMLSPYNAAQKMIQDIRQNTYKVGFEVRRWTFLTQMD
jgi:hypothetical protein